MNTEKRIVSKGNLKLDFSIDGTGKSELECLVEGDFKSLIYLITLSFEKEPMIYELMKEAVEFQKFRSELKGNASAFKEMNGLSSLFEVLSKVKNMKNGNN